MVKLKCCWVLVQFEAALDVAEVVVLVLQVTRDHVSQGLLVLPRARLVGSRGVGLLLGDSGGLVKGPGSHKALLASCSLNVEDQTICWELLARLDAKNVAGFDVGPAYGNPALDLPGDHEELDLLVVDLVRHFPLPMLEDQVPNGHKSDIYKQSHYGEAIRYLVVLIGVENHDEEEDG